MQKRRRVILATMLALSIGNYARLKGNENIRTIQFISIFVMGILAGLLLHELILAIREKGAS